MMKPCCLDRLPGPPCHVSSASPSPASVALRHSHAPPPRHRLASPPCCSPPKTWQPDPSQDTRIHWNSPDEGWVGGSAPDSLPPGSSPVAPEDAASSSSEGSSVLDTLLLSLISQATDTHYEFLGVAPDADVEQIKFAYRKLSKQYHPDTTSLPLDVAAEKFIRLRQAYNVLSSVEERRFYDWALAQEVSRQQGGRFIWPYEADRTQRGGGSQRTPWESEQMAKGDSFRGSYMKLSDQAQTALVFDFFAIIVSISCIIYVAYFKH